MLLKFGRKSCSYHLHFEQAPVEMQKHMFFPLKLVTHLAKTLTGQVKLAEIW